MIKWFILAYIVISILLFNPTAFVGGDNFVYIALAESLVTQQGYRNIHLEGSPPHTHYPPGFPLLLTPIVLVFGKNIIAFKVLVMITGLIGFVFYHKIIQHIAPPFTMRLSLLYLSVPLLIVYGHWVLSEVPYLMFSMMAIYYVVKK